MRSREVLWGTRRREKISATCRDDVGGLVGCKKTRECQITSIAIGDNDRSKSVVPHHNDYSQGNGYNGSQIGQRSTEEDEGRGGIKIGKCDLCMWHGMARHHHEGL